MDYCSDIHCFEERPCSKHDNLPMKFMRLGKIEQQNILVQLMASVLVYLKKIKNERYQELSVFQVTQKLLHVPSSIKSPVNSMMSNELSKWIIMQTITPGYIYPSPQGFVNFLHTSAPDEHWPIEINLIN